MSEAKSTAAISKTTAGVPPASGHQDDFFLPPPKATPHIRRQLDDLLGEVAEVIPPVWPLKDYVAVNPYAGLTERSFFDARSLLQLFSDCETLMPLRYFADQYHRGELAPRHIATAIAELSADELVPDAAWTVESLVELLESPESANLDEAQRVLRTIADHGTKPDQVDWTETVCDEIGKYCSAHYDDGQAVWQSPERHVPLYQAWLSQAKIDRNVEILGITGFRALVAELPHVPDAAVVYLLNRLGVPEQLWQSFLLCQAFSVPGWSAWTKYQTDWTSDQQAASQDMVGLLAMRLAYDVGLSEALGINIDWEWLCKRESASFRSDDPATANLATARYILLRAGEVAYRDELMQSLAVHLDADSQSTSGSERKLAQMVFCIDVRSERIRRHLESQSANIETFGFAGFFAMPIEFVSLGCDTGDSHLPVLLKPQFQVKEDLQGASADQKLTVSQARADIRSWRKLWKGFQMSAAGCFSFVETTGFLYGWKLFARALGFRNTDFESRYDAVDGDKHQDLGPVLSQLEQQGLDTPAQVDLAEGMLKNLGLTKNFARLVVFCGHASQTENNPLAAGLDCGACGGHSGQPNARFAAMLLNQPAVRAGLFERGITIPADTHFMGALHNTTLDKIEWFDLSQLPSSHQEDFEALQSWATHAGEHVRLERMPMVASDTVEDLMRRANDWSEVRPEWGLAGNAAFVVGPRALTKNSSLQGRSFLHSYDHRSDESGAVLENIMTAPMIVAHWINMQYYASVADHQYFGSGDKMIHNVVGRFGILSGNGGDLMTGLPWQSLHTGTELQHAPMRLQVVIAAPREMIDLVIKKHALVENLLRNDWLHLVAIDDGQAYRYSNSSWDSLSDRDPSSSKLTMN